MSFRILVADESLPLRRLVCRFLEAVGVGRPVDCESADETLALVKHSAFDLIIIDSQMPSSHLGGSDLIRAIRSLNADVPLLIMTTEADQESIDAALNAGATEYLVKPFGVEARQRLLELCQQPRPVEVARAEQQVEARL